MGESSKQNNSKNQIKRLKQMAMFHFHFQVDCDIKTTEVPMKKRLLILMIIALTQFLYTEKLNRTKDWPYVPVEKVKACLYNLDNSLGPRYHPIKEKRMDKTIQGEPVPLSNKETARLIQILNRPIVKQIDGLSKSHIPHHAFIFFNHKNEAIAAVSVCIDCETLRFIPPLKGHQIRGANFSEPEIRRFEGVIELLRQMLLKKKLPVFKSPFEYRKLIKKN